MFEAASHGEKQTKTVVLEWLSVFTVLGVASWGTLQLMVILARVLSEVAVPFVFPSDPQM